MNTILEYRVYFYVLISINLSLDYVARLPCFWAPLVEKFRLLAPARQWF